jgi:hypothetical protein
VAAEIQINCGAAKVAALPYAGGIRWTQAYINAVWRAIGYPDPVPQMPKTMEGWYRVATRGPRMLALTPKGKDGSLRGVTKEENKFWNFWGQAVEDPCRKQSGISKIAGGILQIASIYFPVLGYFQAAATAVNTVQDVKRQQNLVADATDILTSSAQQIAAANNPAPVTTLAVTQPTAPPLVAPATAFNPPAFADPLAPAPRTTTPARRKYTTRDYAIAAGLGVGLYLLIRRIRTR